MSRTEAALQPPLGEISNFTDPPDLLKSVNITIQITCMALVTPLVLLRTWVRVKRQGLFNLEDWSCLGTWVGFMAYCLFTLILSFDGGGINQWNVTQYHLERFHHTAFGGSLVYGPAAFLCKVTLLRVSTRIFQPLRIWVIIINTFIALMFAYYFTVLIVKVRICTPINGFWDTSVKASCLDVFKVFIGDTFVSVLTDIAILLVPIPLIWGLRLPIRQKIKIFAMLGAGGLATAQSVARLVMVLEIGADPDETVSIIRFSILGSTELSIGLICATLPALNSLLTHRTAARAEAQVKEMLSFEGKMGG